MSKDEALAEVQALVDAGTVLLEAPTVPGRINLDGWDPDAGAKLDGCVAGVVVRYWPTATKGTEQTLSSGVAPDRLDPRNALALIHLCQWLRDAYGVTELYHAGISGDAPGGRVDCHGQGRAVDLVGVWRPASEAADEMYLTVFDDWGNVAIDGLTPGGDWPPGTGGATSFRLDDPSADPVAAQFFRDLYVFIAGEWQDRTSGFEEEGNPTLPGSDSGFIMHPDHKDSDPSGKHGREAHKNHVHMQIGVTGTE
jgi:hypothetical protein